MLRRWIMPALVMCWMAASSVLAQSPLVGAWVFEDPAANARVELKLNADGSGTMAGQAITWQAGEGVLSITNGPDTFMYRFELQGDTLTVTGADLPRPLIFKRVGGQPAPRGGGGLGGAVGGGNDAPAPPPAGGGGGGGRQGGDPNAPVPGGPVFEGELPPVRPGPGPRPNENQLPPAPAGNLAQVIVGAWIDEEGVVLEFTPDGRFIVEGETGRYTLQGDILTIAGPNGQVQMRLRVVDNDNIDVTMNGETQRAKRVRPGQGGGNVPPHGGPVPPAPHGGNDRNAMPPDARELIVGTWRDSLNDTIVFVPNGDYLWQGNTFKWSVQGNVITIVGPAGAINVQFQFEGRDRMHVSINGQRDVLTRVGGAPGGGGGQPPVIPPPPGGDRPPVGGNAPGVQQGNLIGKWRDNAGQQMEFFANGQMTYAGNQLGYSLNGDTLTFNFPQGQVPIKIRWESADRVQLMFPNGGTDTLTRVR